MRPLTEAEASRELAQRFTAENLREFEFTRLEALHGEILVSRAARDMLEPGHVGAHGSSRALAGTRSGTAPSKR